MNYNNLHKIKILDLTLEEILYNLKTEEFYQLLLKHRQNGFLKIIFIIKHYNKDIEKLSIECLKNNFKVMLLYGNNIKEDNTKFWNILKNNENVILIFSNQVESLKKIAESKIYFDPLRDDISDLDIHDIFDHCISISEVSQNPPDNRITEFRLESLQKNLQIDEHSLVKQNISTKESTKEIITSDTKEEDVDVEKNQIQNNPNTSITSIENSEIPSLNSKDISYIDKTKHNIHKNHLIQDKEKTNNKHDHLLQKEDSSYATIKKDVIKIDKNQKKFLETKEFKLSKFTIRTKLLSIIITLMVGSTSLMIYLASLFFKRDIETRIQENNTSLVNLVSQRIEDSIQQIYSNAEIVIKTNQNLKDSPNILSIGIVKPEKENFLVEKWIVNESLLEEIKASSVVSFDELITIYKDSIFLSLSGIFNLVNVSPKYKTPVLMLTAPSKNYLNRLLVILISSKNINNNLPNLTGGQIFIVNRNGDILASTNLELAISGANLKEIPIVKMMLESKLDNGLTSFSYLEKEYLGAFKKISFSGLGFISITDKNIALEPVYATLKRNIYILIIILIIATILIYFFSKTISDPINELAIATDYVEREDYSIRVIPKTKDEVGLLTYSFNKMVKGLEEREKMKDAFGRFVNKEIAEKAMRGEIKLGGEKKMCAVFFSDLRGFTAMSENMKPEEVVEYLNRYFTLMVDCVEKTHGIVDKFIGDAVMATWGSIASFGNDAENSINGALMMRKALIEFNQYNKAHNLPIAKFGCGINYGEVVSGQIGSEKKLEFTVIGDTVNLASRIESLNKPFATDILISQDTYNQVKDIFDVVKMPAIKVKGKKEPQTIYCVLGRKDDPTRPKNLEELRKLVGIDWEPQIKEGQETLEDEKEEKFQILNEKQRQ